MKTIYYFKSVIIILIAITFNSCRQEISDPFDENYKELWEMRYGTIDDECGLDIIENDDYNYLLLSNGDVRNISIYGDVNDYYSQDGIYSLAGNSYYNFAVVGRSGFSSYYVLIKNRYNIKEKTFSGYGGFNKIKGLSNNIYLIGGSKRVNTEYYQPHIVKIDENINILWEKGFGDTHSKGFVKDIIISNDGNIIALCISKTYNNFIKEWVPHICLASLDQDGNLLTYKDYTGVFGSGLLSITKTSDNGYIAVGFNYNLGFDTDILLVKIDQSLNIKWKKGFGGSGNDEAYKIIKLSYGEYLICGYTESIGNGNKDVYLLKVDEDGNKIWDRTFGGKDDDIAYSVCETYDGGFMIVGSTKSFSAGENDIYLIKVIRSNLK
ncbi:hypothetical protein KAU43_01465 [candidate division WOR-3 bacterium]|nr:hypothetical protein [candidate division WOR-3 bacterium]